MRVELEHVVRQPAERVFGVMADPRNRPLWQEGTRSVEAIDPGPTRVGTRWRERQAAIGTCEMRVAELEPGRRWVEAGTAEGGEGRVEVDLSPEGPDATRLRVAVEIRLRGRRRLIEPAVGPMVRRQMPRDLDRLEALIAGGGPPGGTQGGAPAGTGDG